MGAAANFTNLTGKLIRRLGDDVIRRRLVDAHRAVAAMGQGTLSGYVGVSRDLLRTIAAEGMTHPDECLLLMELASEVREGAIVEIGSYRGRSTIALATGSFRGHGAPVYAVEPHEQFSGVLGGCFGPDDKTAFEQNVARSPHARLIHLISATSQTAAKNWGEKIGLLWIDGDHRYEAVRRDFDLWSQFLLAGGRIAFDDSTVEGLGPHMLIEEILAAGRYECLRIVGKVSVLGRTGEA